jgi:hypothetical protein
MGAEIQRPGEQHNNGQGEIQQLIGVRGHSRKQHNETHHWIQGTGCHSMLADETNPINDAYLYSHAYLSERSESCSVLAIQVGPVELDLEVVNELLF